MLDTGLVPSPPAEVVDFEADGRDIANLLDRPSHLVGFSYRAFSHVAEVIAEPIGADLITIAGGRGVQHRSGFNDRVLALWAEAESASL